MNAERAREFLLSLPHVVETQQWGGILFWVGDQAIGGRTCAMMNPDPGTGMPITWPAGQERFNELLELDGIVPAPYMARNFWVSAERLDAFRDREWQEQLTAAHQLTYAKLAPKTRSILAMTKAEQKKVIAERRKLIAAKAAAKKQTKT